MAVALVTGTRTGTDDVMAEPKRVIVVAEKDVERPGDVNSPDAVVELSGRLEPDSDRDGTPSA